MKTPERNYLTKIGTLFLLLIGCNEVAFAQVNCNAPIRTRENIVLCQGDTVLFVDGGVSVFGSF